MILSNKIMLIVFGLLIAFVSWLFFNSFQKYSFYILFLILVVAILGRKFSKKE